MFEPANAFKKSALRNVSKETPSCMQVSECFADISGGDRASCGVASFGTGCCNIRATLDESATCTFRCNSDDASALEISSNSPLCGKMQSSVSLQAGPPNALQSVSRFAGDLHDTSFQEEPPRRASPYCLISTSKGLITKDWHRKFCNSHKVTNMNTGTLLALIRFVSLVLYSLTTFRQPALYILWKTGRV